MDTLKDIWASLVAGVQERTTNPLTFSFIASWCVWNYKFLFILTGDGTTSSRLQLIDNLYPWAWQTYFGKAFGLPLVTAFLYVYCYPSLSKHVVNFYRRKQVEIANVVRDAEKARVLTSEEVDRLTRNHETERTEWELKEEALKAQVDRLRSALAGAEKELSDERLQLSSTRNNIQDATSKPFGDLPNPEATAETGGKAMPVSPPKLPNPKVAGAILSTLSQASGSRTSKDIATATELNHSVTIVVLEELEKMKYVQKSSLGRWGLTSQGHQLVALLIGSGGQ